MDNTVNSLDCLMVRAIGRHVGNQSERETVARRREHIADVFRLFGSTGNGTDIKVVLEKDANNVANWVSPSLVIQMRE